MAKININSLTTFKPEQIKIIGKIESCNKEIEGTLNKTLDLNIIEQLPNELLESLTRYVFGNDYSLDELTQINENVQTLIKAKQAEVEFINNEYEN